MPFMTDLVGRRARMLEPATGKVGKIISAWIDPSLTDPERAPITWLTILWPEGTTCTTTLGHVELEFACWDFDEEPAEKSEGASGPADSAPVVPSEPLTVLSTPLTADETAVLQCLLNNADATEDASTAWHWAKVIACDAAVDFAVVERLRTRGLFEIQGSGDSMKIRPSGLTRRVLANPDNLTTREQQRIREAERHWAHLHDLMTAQIVSEQKFLSGEALAEPTYHALLAAHAVLKELHDRAGVALRTVQDERFRMETR